MYREMLSVAEDSLMEKLGEPELCLEYRGDRQLIYPGEDDPITFTIKNGVVAAIDHVRERRRSGRVKPFSGAVAHIQTGEGYIRAEIIDVSSGGVACRIPAEGVAPGVGAEGRVCIILVPRHGGAKLHASLIGNILSVGEGRLVFAYRRKPYTHSLRAVESYVSKEFALNRLSTAVFAPTDKRERSDRCLVCVDRFCGVGVE